MRPALDVFWETARDWYNGRLGLATMNLIWLLASLTVVLLPPVTAGLYVVTSRIGHGTGGRIEDLLSGGRAYMWLSYRWALVNIAAGIAFAVGFSFYGATETASGAIIRVLFAVVGIVWLAVQFYVWSFLIEQEDKHLRVALKNALFLTLANPVYLFIDQYCWFGIGGKCANDAANRNFCDQFYQLSSRAVIERLKTYGMLPGALPSSHDGASLGDNKL